MEPGTIAVGICGALGIAIITAFVGYLRKAAERRHENNEETRATVARISVELEALKTAAASSPELIDLSGNITNLTETVLTKMGASVERLTRVETTMALLEKQVHRLADDHVGSRDLARATMRGLG